MGAVVGDFVGILVGARVGPFVGVLVGALVGGFTGAPGVNTQTRVAVLQLSIVVESPSLHSLLS
jgi:outer membrane lipoprotein SlyB